MFLYIFRVILVFWIISILLKWIERFVRPSGGQQQSQPPNTPADPDTTPSMGKIVDADFEDLDGGA